MLTTKNYILIVGHLHRNCRNDLVAVARPRKPTSWRSHWWFYALVDNYLYIHTQCGGHNSKNVPRCHVAVWCTHIKHFLFWHTYRTRWIQSRQEHVKVCGNWHKCQLDTCRKSKSGRDGSVNSLSCDLWELQTTKKFLTKNKQSLVHD